MVLLRSLIVCLGLLLPLGSWANENGESAVKVELIQENETIQAGRPFWVGLKVEVEDGWHVYWKNPGDVGMPLNVEWQLPDGFEAEPLQWPFPDKFTTSNMVGFGYNGTVTLLALIKPPAHLNVGMVHELTADVEWLVCSAMSCQPGAGTAHLDVKVGGALPQADPMAAALFEDARSKLPSSNLNVMMKRKAGVVQLEVPKLETASDPAPFVGAYFFPEKQNVIDSSVDATIAMADDKEKGYVVSLKGADEIGVTGQSLKGVLVLHKQDGNAKSIHAFDIDATLEGDGVGNQEPLVEGTKGSFDFEGGIGLALLFAFLGGMILNLMPCVLPVISLKIMSFVKMAGQSRALTFKHGLWFSFGVLFSFWVLAGAILVLRSYGQLVGWGFQLQEPIFVIILATILFVFALSLFGIFEWGLVFASWAGQQEADKANKESGFAGSFFSGILATAVATPCTGPFLGSAVGFALTLPAAQAMLIFTSLGLGMCFPYLLLAAFPSCLRFLPKPGAWMETFKQLMGFVLLASVLWLMWVFSAQTNTISLMCLMAAFLLFSIGAWIYGRGGVPSVGKVKRIMAYAAVILCFYAGFEVMLIPKASWSAGAARGDEWDGWETFSPQRVAELRAQGTPVLVDFTAKWCLICQTNHFVLDSADVRKELASAGVVKLKADWTKNDPVITQELAKFGRNSVPLYLYYGPGSAQEPVILPQVLTPEVVKSHLSGLQDVELASSEE